MTTIPAPTARGQNEERSTLIQNVPTHDDAFHVKEDLVLENTATGATVEA